MGYPHPYVAFERTKLWSVLDKAVGDLVANRDLEETTARRYIVGYLAKQLHDNELLKELATDDLGVGG
jgi:hypothetical protein